MIWKKLQFAGVLLLNCPLKEDTMHVINDLVFANHKVMMVTGDNALTACDVARRYVIDIATLPLMSGTFVCAVMISWLIHHVD